MTDPNHPCPDCAESPEAHSQAVCDRRVFLRRSIAGVLGMTVATPILSLVSNGAMGGLSAVFANATAEALPIPSNPAIKSIVVLWMNGGPSQIDTFDPKPGTANGGEFKAIATSLPGVRVSSHLPRVAERMDRMALIRCMKTGEGNHQRARTLMRTGFRPNPTVAYPGIGSIVSFEKGDAASPLPQNVSINGPGEPAGLLGLSYDPLLVGNPSRSLENLSPVRGMTDARIDRRMEMLLKQDEFFRERIGGKSREADGHDDAMRKAVAFMRSEETAAFDLSGESQSVRARYGGTKFGEGCLMARRLVEAGVRFVEVTLTGWDTHDDNFTRVAKLSAELDGGMSALLADLEERDLLDSTLVVCMGEFGRTPTINPRDGRDHFPGAWSVLLAGGGFRQGTVIGETSADGTEIRGNHVTTADLHRTILWSAGIDPDYEYYSPEGRPLKYADGGRLIGALLTA